MSTCVSSNSICVFNILQHLAFTISLQSRYHHYAHFADEKTDRTCKAEAKILTGATEADSMSQWFGLTLHQSMLGFYFVASYLLLFQQCKGNARAHPLHCSTHSPFSVNWWVSLADSALVYPVNAEGAYLTNVWLPSSGKYVLIVSSTVISYPCHS